MVHFCVSMWKRFIFLVSKYPIYIYVYITLKLKVSSGRSDLFVKLYLPIEACFAFSFVQVFLGNFWKYFTSILIYPKSYKHFYTLEYFYSYYEILRLCLLKVYCLNIWAQFLNVNCVYCHLNEVLDSLMFSCSTIISNVICDNCIFSFQIHSSLYILWLFHIYTCLPILLNIFNWHFVHFSHLYLPDL